MQDYAHVDENMCPVFRRAPPGADETYDTLDDVDLGGVNTVEKLYEQIMGPLTGTVGMVVTGMSGLSNPSDGYWGRALSLSTGEHLQMRILPRGSYRKVPGDDDTRMIAVRRTSHGSVPFVGFAVLYHPREIVSFDLGKTPLTNGCTIGCRGVHLLLPSLFTKHDPHRKKDTGHAQLDLDGFHSVRPSTLMITVNTPRGVKESQIRSYSMSPGDGYLVMAGHMAGVDIPDPLTRAADVMTDSDHSRHIVAKQRRMTKSIGETKTATYVASALTLCELLCAEGILGIMCNSFFTGAQPDMFFSPVGLPLCIAMSIHIACNPERFDLPPCTKQDTHVNLDVMRAFNSRWGRVMLNGFRALDVAIKSAHDNATAQCKKEKEIKMHFEDNMKFWQRVGQRMIAKIMSNPSDEVRGGTKAACNTKFGTAECILDPITECKYSELGKRGFCLPIKEAPIDKIFLAPRCDLRTTMGRVQDNIEAWLRTGMFGQHRLSKPNINIASPVSSRYREGCMPCHTCGTCFKCSCPETSKDGAASSSSDSDDNDDILDNKICISAMESAAGAMAIAMIHGAYVMHQFGIQCFLASDHCTNKCADCEEDVTVYEGTLFSSKESECRKCNRKRCFKCTTNALRPGKPVGDCCLRCEPGAPSVMHAIVPNARRAAKPSAKKADK
jgi:hypothetical protein